MKKKSHVVAEIPDRGLERVGLSSWKNRGLREMKLRKARKAEREEYDRRMSEARASLRQEYIQKTVEAKREYQRRYYQMHKQKVAEYQRAYEELKAEEIRETRKAYQRMMLAEKPPQVVSHLRFILTPPEKLPWLISSILNSETKLQPIDAEAIFHPVSRAGPVASTGEIVKWNDGDIFTGDYLSALTRAIKKIKAGKPLSSLTDFESMIYYLYDEIGGPVPLETEW